MSHCLMKSDGVDRMFPFAKRDISEWGSRYEPKNNQPGGLSDLQATPMSIKHPQVTFLLLFV